MPVLYGKAQSQKSSAYPSPPGHAGVLLIDGNRSWLFAGDATFDEDQTERLAVSGATEVVSDARSTQRLLKQAVQNGTTLLPAHDPAALGDTLPLEN